MSEIRPSSDLRNKYKEIASICKEKKKPVFITVNGRGDTVLLDIEDEIYRTCNWLSKKPPKGVETFKGLVTKVDCLDSDIEFFNNGELAKGEFSEIKLQLVQGLFSFKCMVESVNNTFAINDLTEQLKNLYSNYTNTQTDGGFLEVGFNLIDAFEENCQLNGVKTKAYMYKTFVNFLLKKVYNCSR